MVTQYGMSEKFGLMGLATQENQYLTGRTVLNCGDATAAEIDVEVMRMLKGAYAEAKRLLSENRDALDKIADFLIEKETITGKEFMKIFRQVKGHPGTGGGDPAREKRRSREALLWIRRPWNGFGDTQGIVPGLHRKRTAGPRLRLNWKRGSLRRKRLGLLRKRRSLYRKLPEMHRKSGKRRPEGLKMNKWIFVGGTGGISGRRTPVDGFLRRALCAGGSVLF